MVWGRYNVLIFVLVTTTIATKIDETWVDINGLVKVKVNGVEGKICSVNWDDRDAEVLCREVGKTKSKSYIKKGDSNVPTLIADVQCVGNETRLEDCSYSVVSENATCTPPNSSWNSAGTYCYDSYNEVTYSLEHVRYGRVRATRNGYERYLCSESHFSYSPARAVCRDMGYKSGETFESEDLSMSQNPSWWKNSFDCEGKEPLLGACARASWEDVMPPYYNENSCIYNTPAVLCHGAARLHTRQRSSSGVVGLYHDGEYRAICSDHFDSKAVAVVCNSLGFNRGYKAPSNSYRYYNYYLRIENVTCSGTEKSLDQCSYDYTTSTSCSGPATVACIDQTDPDSALPDGSTKIVNQRVLIKYHDIWGTICYDNWDDVDAKIVCQQHGFDDGQALQLSHDSMKPRWYKNVTCQSGTDQTLDTCDKDTDTGYCYYTFDAGAYCFNNTNVATFSFTDSESTKYGRLQITRDNITHYLCDLSGNFNYREMEFICKQMGFIKGQEYVPLKTFVQGEYWSNDINCKNNVPSLDACTSGSWKEVTNDGSCQYNVPSIYCYGNVRLHSDFFNATGHIQVYKNDRYEYVCQNNFGSKQLNVVCNELGFQHNGRLLPVNAYRGFPTGYGNIPNGYSCSGNEKSILDCTSFDALPCNQPATVACFQSVEDKLAGTGQVMVSSDDVVLLMVDGVWGTICAGGFDDVSATVMCNQQGYEHGVSVIKSERYEKPMLTQSVNCTGSETNISDCQIDIVTDSGTMCSNDKRAGVRCFNSDDINQYRLVDGDGYRYGRLMVTRKNKTGYVCSQHSDVGYKDANVVCKQLGFSSGERYDMPEVQAPYGTRYWSNKLDCSSNEPNIDTCMKDEWTEIMHDGKDSCPYSVPSVFCYGQVRLHTKYLNTSGAVLVRHNDGWVTVCDDSFDDNAAKVVCGEIGFVRNEGKMLSTNSFYDSIVPYNWPPKILDINCTGNENFISECNFTYNETYGICNRYNYAVVSCTPDNTSTTIMPYTTPTYPNTTANSQLPLASTNQTRWLSDKRVSLFINGMWSGICNTEWDDVDANIFCKELGYEKGVALEKYEKPYQPRYRYNISCNGTESTILDCSYDTFDDNGTCQYIPDAAAYCYNSNTLIEVRLVGGPKLNSGRVEVMRDNKWGWFCEEGFYTTKARIICKQLRYKSGDMYYIDINETNPYMWRTNLRCQGSEPYLDACDNQVWRYEGFYNSWCQSNPPAVFCYGEVRLHTGFDNKTGVVEVYIDDDYYSLCADDFPIENAKVVCRQLGFSSTAARILPSQSFGNQGRIVEMKYSCNGSESKLADCMWSNETCSSRYNQAVISCDSGPSQGSDGDIQIDSNGFVSISFYGIWGRICGVSWDNVAAQIVCKQMGYETGLAHIKYKYESDKPLWVNEVNCNGSEHAIKDCQFTTHLNSSCTYGPSAFAYCYNFSTAPTYSFTGGSTSNSGYVETSRDGETGYICESGEYRNYEPDTACRSLGYVEGDYYPMDQLPFTANFWKSSFYCHNNEPVLHICSTDPWSYLSYTNNTYQYEREQCRRSPLSVFCYNKVRLHSKFRNSSGIVLQRRDNQKYSYCSDDVDINTASVLCKQVGFASARHIVPIDAYEHANNYQIGFQNLSCPSGAVKLDQCTSYFDLNGTCDGGALAVICDDGNLLPDDATRILEDGTVVISKYGVWGTISSVGWDDIDAKVVCKENGYDHGRAYSRYSRDKPRWMYNVSCTGAEAKLANCSHQTSGENNTEIYALNAAAYCYNQSDVGSYELENGNYGRLLTTREGMTGYVCDTGYVSRVDLAIACRTLGYEDGDIYPSPVLPYGTLFWSNRFTCDIGAPLLESCVRSDWFNQTDDKSCRYHKTFSVYCYGKVRLNVKYRNNTGILLINDNSDKTFAVCSEGFDMISANVSCKEMGFSGVRRILPSNIFSNDYKIMYSDFNCTGDEASLLDCPHNQQGCNASYVVLECDDELSSMGNYTMTTPHYNNYNYTPSYNNSDGYTPSYNNTGGYTPSYNNSYGYTPSYNNSDGYTPSYNNSDGYTPSYNTSGGYTPSYNNSDGYTPSYNISDGYTPSYNNSDGYTPSYNNSDGYTPSYNNSDGYTPSYNNSDGYTPSYNNSDGYTPSYNNSYGYTPSYNNSDGYTPSYNNSDGYTPSYNNSNGYTPSYNNSNGYTPSYNNTGNTTNNSASLSLIVSRNNIAWERWNRRILLWENGTWTSICSDDWDDTDASVACKELGYDNGVAEKKNDAFVQDLPKSMFNVSCEGNESRLQDCKHDRPGNQCNSYKDAAAFCYDSDDGSSYTTKVPSANSTNLTSTEQPGSGSNSTKSSTEQPGSSSNSTKSSTEQPGSGSNSTKSTTDSSGSGPNFTKSTSKPSGSGTDPTNSNGNDGKDNPADGAPGSSAACLSGIKSSLLLIIVVVIIGNF